MAETLSVLYTTAFLGLVTAALLVRQRSTRSLSELPGPSNDSWIGGNTTAFLQSENVGDMDTKLVNRYGKTFRIRGTFSEAILYTADPKGLNYVLNTCGYTFQKNPFLLRLLAGPSVIGVEGRDHARQRKILLPGFTYGALKEFVPQFMHIAQKAASQWRDLILESGHPSSTIDVHTWLARITLDSIGHVAFGSEFGALDNADSELMRAYRSAFVGMFYKPSSAQLAFGAILQSLPIWTIAFLRRLPVQSMKNMIKFRNAAQNVALGIIQREMQALEQGLPLGKDIMSILVRANKNEDPKGRLSDEELLSQITAIIVGGQDTTASTLVWIFYELSRHPEVQTKLREEIKATRAASTAAGNDDLNATELESMEYTTAVIKETLRFYPIASHNLRKASRDEIIPLSNPIKTISGDEITTVPVKKGQAVLMSFFTYNRIQSLWGEDADEWRPERFLQNGLPSRPKSNFGVYANLSSFSSGVHSCLGWRLAILEMQAILITLVEKFEIRPPPSKLNIEIIRAAAPTLMPLVKGQETAGPQMPLTIASVD